MQKFFKASAETRNFLFEGYGASEDEAREALKTGLLTHEDQHQAAPGFTEEVMDDLQMNEITLGTCYRDREPITGAVPPRPKG